MILGGGVLLSTRGLRLTPCQGRFYQIKNSYDYGEQLRNRSVEAITEKAREIKRDFIDSGKADVLGHFWAGV